MNAFPCNLRPAVHSVAASRAEAYFGCGTIRI